MDWLNNEKNRPIVIAILAVVIIGAAVVVYMMLSGGSGDDYSSSEVSAPVEQPTDATADVNAEQPQPAQPAQPAQQPAGGGGGAQMKAAANIPIETWRPDPFYPLGYKKPKTQGKKPNPPIEDLPVSRIFTPKFKVAEKAELVEKPQPARRLAGVMLGERVSAIIESGGRFERVWPGKMLEDGLAIVDKIERDKVVLRTTDPRPRYITVRMASAPRSASSSVPNVSNVNSGNLDTLPSGNLPPRR